MERGPYVVAVIGGILLLAFSAAAAQTAVLSDQELIDQAVSERGDTTAFKACKRLADQLRGASAERAEAIRAELAARLATAKDAGAVRRIAMAIAVRPTQTATAGIVERFDVADAATQSGLCEALTQALRGLPAAERKALAAPIVPRMLAIVAKAEQPERLACAATRCLGALLSDGYPALEKIMGQAALRGRVADALPSALAGTRDVRALDGLARLCDSASHNGQRIAAIHGIGALIATLHKDGTPIPADVEKAAMARIYQYLGKDGNRELLAVAIRAGGAAVGVDYDETLRQAVLAALSHPDVGVRTAAFDSLMSTQTARSPEVKRIVAQLGQGETDPEARAGAEAVLAATEAEE